MAANTRIMEMLSEMRLEEAVQSLRHNPAAFDPAMVAAMAEALERQAQDLAGIDPGGARLSARRVHALRALAAHGPEPDRMLAHVDLPEGYEGKIVLVLVKGGVFDGTVVLRSGDGWHREILNNTRSELRDLGFPSAEAYPLGGAYAGFDEDGRIVIWGTSDEFGACDKDLAAEMIRSAYPDRPVLVED